MRWLRRVLLGRVARQLEFLEQEVDANRARLLVHPEDQGFAAWEAAITIVRACRAVTMGRAASSVLDGLEEAANLRLLQEASTEQHARRGRS